MTFDTDPAYNEQQDPTDLRFGPDEPCAEALRDPNAGTYDEDVKDCREEFAKSCAATRRLIDLVKDDLASAEYERAIYADHCCDWDDR